ncbi:PhoP regulatory network YrbL family protein [Aliarcobacter cryaerophilus]|uniref:PhoP regulatory network YrbL family protein n=1 Tax=Aliarcobacter cryaerophilus TaxID=28198 RepID=UPI0021B2DF1E|nr:PhoP regulatory network YrbL family protein [Aliarcobacter cryaerophilus]MCT7512591.1 PhoP regulatory network YrbL family protein [Aliarcobacter cryaerophilus]
MIEESIVLTKELFFASGGERDCYVHPDNNKKLIKIEQNNKTRNQNELEFLYYNYLEKNKISQEHIAKCYGYVDTNLGKGLVFEKIVNYNGTEALSFSDVISKNLLSDSKELELIEELKNYIFSNNILFVDVGFFNILCQEVEKDKFKLIIIDGLGGRRVGFKFNLYLKSSLFTKYKIKKQWKKTENEYKNALSFRNGNLFSWDSYSDQPNIIKDREYKKRMRALNSRDYIKLFFTSLVILPFASLLMKFFRGNCETSNQDFIGLGVNLDKDDGKNTQQELVEELGVKNLIIRVPLSDIENLDLYVNFAKSFNEKSKKNILINIIQNLGNISNEELFLKNIEKIFNAFENVSNEFQIGTTINRFKWGFFSVGDFIDFYTVAQKLRDEKYPNIKLLGPSVIDFEYYYNARAMFNLKKIKYDITSTLLYVDRRGSPKNSQYGFFDLKNKIALLYSLVKLSPKTLSNEIYITETNYPISNTAPYAPTSEKECVSLEDYTKYMLEYFEIAKKSKKIKRVYWHQLIAAGYGLVDNRDEKIVKYPQFYAFKEMLQEK